MSAHRLAIAVLATVLVAAALLAPPARSAPAVEYRPPVDAPVVDPFRPPAHPYGPGNRGLQYGTRPGTRVRAAADGLVTFAGFIGANAYVSIRHADGIVTTASYLRSVTVRRGDRVEAGDVIGRTIDDLHFGARLDGEYLDPATLFTAYRVRVRLVPSGTR